MDWIIDSLISEYGRDVWNKKTKEERLMLVASFCKNLTGAIEYINKQTLRNGEWYYCL